MIFKSDKIESQWDTWAYYHDGAYYLYYLIWEDKRYNAFGAAVSRDGVHWNDHGPVFKASSKSTRYLGSGAVWKSLDFEKTGRFICNYSEYRKDEYGEEAQGIYFLWSVDLINWTKYGDEFAFPIDERFYERYGRWDNIFPVLQSDGKLWGTWVGTPKGRSTWADSKEGKFGNKYCAERGWLSDLQGGIAFGYSEDGVNWKAVKPAKIIPDIKDQAKEVGALRKFGNKFYAMLGSPGDGISTYVSSGFTDSYVKVDKNALLFSPGHSYFPRFFETPGETLVVHHSMAGSCNIYTAPLKKALVDNEGVLRMEYWIGNESLKGAEVELNITAKSKWFTGFCDFRQGVVMEGSLVMPCNIMIQADNAFYTLRILNDGCVEMGQTDPFGHFWKMIQSIDRGYPFEENTHFRLLLRQGMLEFYLDDQFIECYKMGCPDSENIRVGTGNRQNLFDNIKVWQMSL